MDKVILASIRKKLTRIKKSNPKKYERIEEELKAIDKKLSMKRRRR